MEAKQILQKAQIILLPVYKRHWVFACKAESSHIIDSTGSTQGRDLLTNFKLWFDSASDKLSSSLKRQWKKAQEAKEGSVLNYTYRLGQWALSREHPDETFLQAVPPLAHRMELLYPSSIDERFVRRRLRLLIKGRIDYHKHWAVIWALITVPSLPLIVSPLPNIPVYYFGYRTWAHYRAWQGAQSLQGLILNIDHRQLSELRSRLLEMQAEGGRAFEAGSWPAELIARLQRYRSVLDAPAGGGASATGGAARSNIGLQADFHRSEELEAILRPGERAISPVEDSAIMEAAELFNFPTRDVLAHVARARKLALGGRS